MVSSILESRSLEHRVVSLTALVDQLVQQVAELKHENAALRQQVCELHCDVGYWKSTHSRAVERHSKTQSSLDEANAEIRQLKAERFGKQSEKSSSTDRSNELVDPQQPASPKNKRGQQRGRPAPKRRDYSHLPTRHEQMDLPEYAKACAVCGKPTADL